MVLRPADANEVVEAWKVAMQLQHEPALLVLTRQALPQSTGRNLRARGWPRSRRLRPGRCYRGKT